MDTCVSNSENKQTDTANKHSVFGGVGVFILSLFVVEHVFHQKFEGSEPIGAVATSSISFLLPASLPFLWRSVWWCLFDIVSLTEDGPPSLREDYVVHSPLCTPPYLSGIARRRIVSFSNNWNFPRFEMEVPFVWSVYTILRSRKQLQLHLESLDFNCNGLFLTPPLAISPFCSGFLSIRIIGL